MVFLYFGQYHQRLVAIWVLSHWLCMPYILPHGMQGANRGHGYH
jgi:hypothetical protein